MKRQMLWWLNFIIATYALSEVFRASRYLTLGEGESSVWMLLLWGTILIIAFLTLGYDAYLKSRAEGKVIHQIRLFEKFYQLQHREKNQ
jgi:hypothetical protein